jgi:hypothetical protein
MATSIDKLETAEAYLADGIESLMAGIKLLAEGIDLLKGTAKKESKVDPQELKRMEEDANEMLQAAKEKLNG